MNTYTRNDALADLTDPKSLFAVREQSVLGVTLPVFTNQPSHLGEMYTLSEKYNDQTFLVYENDHLTYSEARRRATNLAARLVHDFGVRKGDRVALAMRNYPEWCLSYMAVTSIGAVIVTLNAWWQGRELAYGISNTGARVAIVDQERLDRLQSHLKRLDLKVIVARPTSVPAKPIIDLSSLITGDEALPVIDIAPDDDASVFYTSGLTEYPKGVVSTHRSVVSSVFGRLAYILCYSLPLLPEAYRQIVLRWAYQGRDALRSSLPGLPRGSTLVAVPLFHVTGCNTLFLPAFFSGRKLVLMHKWDPERALELIERERINDFTGVPSMGRDLINSPDYAKRDTSSLQAIISGGAACPSAQLSEIKQRIGGSVAAGYGMTETNAMGCVIGGEDYLARPTSVGCAVAPLVDLKIIDEQGKNLEAGCQGEICIKSVSNMRGYWNQPAETADTLRDGWVHTGDLGHMDAEGYLYITGRAKNIVVRGGENISCAEVESVLYEHPGVMEAVVYGVPDERLGEILVTTVVPRAGYELSDKELSAHLSSRLAKFKVPQHIIIQQEPLPRVASGKFDVRELQSRWTSAGRISISIIPTPPQSM